MAGVADSGRSTSPGCSDPGSFGVRTLTALDSAAVAVGGLVRRRPLRPQYEQLPRAMPWTQVGEALMGERSTATYCIGSKLVARPIQLGLRIQASGDEHRMTPGRHPIKPSCVVPGQSRALCSEAEPGRDREVAAAP